VRLATSRYVSVRLDTSRYVSVRLDTSRYVSVRGGAPAGSGAEPQRGLGQSPSGVWGRAESPSRGPGREALAGFGAEPRGIFILRGCYGPIFYSNVATTVGDARAPREAPYVSVLPTLSHGTFAPLKSAVRGEAS